MNGNIEQLNENFGLNIRARAYAQNNPGVSIAEATFALVDEDARAKKTAKAKKAKGKY